MNTVQRLIQAKGYISNPQHWVQGLMYDNRGGYCAIGALYKTFGFRIGNPEQDKAWAEACTYLASAGTKVSNRLYLEAVASSEAVIMALNDQVMTTHSQVMAMFDEAIHMAQQYETVEQIKAQALEGAADEQGPSAGQPAQLVAA